MEIFLQDLIFYNNLENYSKLCEFIKKTAQAKSKDKINPCLKFLAIFSIIFILVEYYFCKVSSQSLSAVGFQLLA